VLCFQRDSSKVDREVYPGRASRDVQARASHYSKAALWAAALNARKMSKVQR